MFKEIDIIRQYTFCTNCCQIVAIAL